MDAHYIYEHICMTPVMYSRRTSTCICTCIHMGHMSTYTCIHMIRMCSRRTSTCTCTCIRIMQLCCIYMYSFDTYEHICMCTHMIPMCSRRTSTSYCLCFRVHCILSLTHDICVLGALQLRCSRVHSVPYIYLTHVLSARPVF